jgi:hypothetical protein
MGAASLAYKRAVVRGSKEEAALAGRDGNGRGPEWQLGHAAIFYSTPILFLVCSTFSFSF